MGQRSVEQALGKLVTDSGFRRQFFEDPAVAAVHAGLQLSAEEVDALARIPLRVLAELERAIDGRICRLAVPVQKERS